MTVVSTGLYPFYQYSKKILEKLIYNRLLFINKHNILTDSLHGFRNNKSTEMTSQIFIENFQESIDKQLHV